jgi:hypothetical protein
MVMAKLDTCDDFFCMPECFFLSDCCNCGTTDSDSSSSSGSELDTAKASEPLSSKVIGVHTVSNVMLFYS